MDDQVNIKFSASIDDLKAKLSQVINQFKATSTSAEDELAGKAAGALGAFGQQATKTFDLIGKKAGEIPETMREVGLTVGAAFAVLGAAGMAAKKYADHNAEMIESTRDFARALGTTTNEVSVLQAALDDVGTSQGEYLGAAKGLSRQLRTNEDDLKRYGLATRDSAGNFRPLNDLMTDAIRILNEHKEGTNRNIASQAMFGRGIEQGSRLLLLNAETIKANRAAVEELNLEVGESAVAAWQDYDNASDRAALTVKAFGKAIAESVLPVATEMTEWFNGVAPAAITALRGALGGLTTAFLALTNGVRVAWETINAMVISVTEPIVALAGAIGAIVTGQGLEAAASYLRNIPKTISGAWETAFDKIAESSAKTSDRIGNVWGWATGGNKAPGDSGSASGTRTAKDKKPGGASLASAELALQKAMQDAALKLELEYLKEQQSIDDAAYKDGLLSTKDYFDRKLELEQRTLQASIDAKMAEQRAAAAALKDAQTRAGAADEKERPKAEADVLKFKTAEVKLAGEIAVLEMQRADNVRQIGDAYADVSTKLGTDLEAIRIARAKQAADSEVEMQRGALDQLRALRQVSADDAFQIEAQLESKSYAALLASIAARRAALTGSQDEQRKQQAQLDAELEQGKQQHEQRMTAIERAAEQERRKFNVQGQQAVQQGFATMVRDILSGQKRIGEVLRNFAASIARTFEDLIAQKFAERLFGAGTAGGNLIDALIKPILNSVGSIASAFLEMLGIVVPAQHAAGITAVLSNAAIAATAAMASVAAIPVIGWAMAPEVGAATYATAVGYMASAKGGQGSVPFDGQMTELHRQEMVLPAWLASGVRQMAQPGELQGVVASAVARMQPQQAADTVHVHFAVNAVDTRTGTQFLMDNSKTIAKSVEQELRRHWRPKV